MNEHKDKFLLEKGITFLNHGSYGACPKEVFDVYQDWQRRLEAQPVQFLANDLYAGLKDSRSALSEFICCSENEIIFFPKPDNCDNQYF